MDGYNLTTLMKRLEAATSRLEDLVTLAPTGGAASGSTDSRSATTAAGSTAGSATAGTTTGPSSNSNNAGSAANVGAGSGSAAKPAPVAASPGSSVLALSGKLQSLKSAAAALDPVFGEQATAFVAAADAVAGVIAVTPKVAKPDLSSPAYVELLKPLSAAASKVVEIRETQRTSDFANSLATLAEGVPAFGWVSTDAPADYVQDFKDSAQFYANRALKDNKANSEWVKLFLSYLTDLKVAVKKDFPEGLKWTGTASLESVLKDHPAVSSTPAASTASSAAPSPSSGAPPPPPPPPSAEFLKNAAGPPAPGPGSSSSSGQPMSAVLSDLSQGESIRSGLRHVDRKALPPKPTAPKPTAPKPKAGGAAATSSAPAPKKPSKTLEVNRWYVENFVDSHDLVIETEMNQAVLIDNCSNCTIQIKGKATSVAISKCSKVGVTVESLVSGVEIINSTDFGLQVFGVLPSLTIDKSHNGQTYLSKDSLEVSIYTSQTSALNINVPGASGEAGDWVEHPLPEQIINTIVNGAVKSQVVTLT